MSVFVQYSSNLTATKNLCAVKYVQKSGVQCLELVSSQQFRKDTAIESDV